MSLLWFCYGRLAYLMLLPCPHICSSYLKSKDTMRDKTQLIDKQRELAWSEYVKGAALHRSLSANHCADFS